jgi:predicted nuclease of predicted toxin-antitoxin system
MKFKIDVNLPIEFADLLQSQGYDASTIYSEQLKGAKDSVLIKVCQIESRILITLDIDFANTQAYPPEMHEGIIVLRVRKQDKPYLITFFQKVIPSFRKTQVRNHLWIVEEGRIRVR